MAANGKVSFQTIAKERKRTEARREKDARREARRAAHRAGVPFDRNTEGVELGDFGAVPPRVRA